jgi:hypothetical protein
VVEGGRMEKEALVHHCVIAKNALTTNPGHVEKSQRKALMFQHANTLKR